MDGDILTRSQTTDLTRILAEQASAVTYLALPEPVRALARQCVLDYYGVALAGADDPLAKILLDELAEAAGAAQASVIGHKARLPALSAALVNGAIGHALDYDDVNLAMPGHPSVAILPGLTVGILTGLLVTAMLERHRPSPPALASAPAPATLDVARLSPAELETLASAPGQHELKLAREGHGLHRLTQILSIDIL